MEYSIPKPAYPLYLKLLAGLVTTGLLGLGIVSFHTFNQVHGAFVAGVYSAIIEVGASLDAIGLAGGIHKRTWWLIPAVVLTIVGSGWYNYAAVAQSGATWGIKDPVQLDFVAHAIAWLPLASLSFMALGLGFKIADHEADVKQWEFDRQAWLDGQAEQAKQARLDAQRVEQEARERQAEAARKERERLAEIEATSRKQIELARIAQQDREAQRQARLEARRIRLETATKTVEVSTPLPGSTMGTSRGTYEDFQELLSGNGHHAWKNAELAERFRVSVRTITEWRKKYQESHPIPQPEVN